MKHLFFVRKFGFLILATTVLFISGCYWFDDLSLRSGSEFLPKDVDFSAGVFYKENSESAFNLEKFKKIFSEFNLDQKIFTLYDTKIAEKKFSGILSSNILPVLSKDFNVYFGAYVSPDFDFKKDDIFKGRFYFVLKSLEIEKIRVIINEMGKDYKITYGGNEKQESWFFEDKGWVILRYKEFFVFTYSLDEVRQALKRFKKNEGFLVQNLGEQNALGYVKIFKNYSLPDFYKGGEFMAVVSANNDGMKIVNNYENSENIDNKNFGVIAEKILGENIFYYYEQKNFGQVLKNIFSVIAYSKKAVLEAEKPLDESVDERFKEFVPVVDENVEEKKVSRGDKIIKEDAEEEIPFDIWSEVKAEKKSEQLALEEEVKLVENVNGLADYYGNFISQMKRMSGLNDEKLEKIMSGNFGFAVYDLQSFFPAAVFAFSFDKENVDDMKKFSAGISNYIDETIVTLDEILKSSKVSGLIKKDDYVKNGNVLKKVYVDFTAFPKAMIAQYKPILDEVGFENLKLEIHYGLLIDDGIFVFAFYPNFNEVIGQSSVKENDFYKEIVADVGAEGMHGLSFLKIEPALKMAESYLNIFVKTGFVEVEKGKEYAVQMQSLYKIKYLLSVLKKTGSGMNEVYSVKIE